MSDERDRTNESGCGECDSCLAGYGAEFCTNLTNGKTNGIPSVHNNGDDPLEY
jgi:hypothetical protein